MGVETMTQLEQLTAWFPLEDHEVREGGRGKKLVYVSSEAITRRLNDIFGLDWETFCRGYHVEEALEHDRYDKRQYAAHAQVDMTLWLENGTRTRSGTGGAVNTDLDMAVKSALVEGKKKAFYEFGGCGYLWDEKNCNRIIACLDGDPAVLTEILDHYGIDIPDGSTDDDLIDLVFAIR